MNEHDEHDETIPDWKQWPRVAEVIGVGLVWLVAGLIIWAASGCKSVAAASVDDQIKMMNALADFARQNDMAMSVTAKWNGRPSLGASQDFYFNTGLDLTATIMGNASDEEPKSVVVSSEPTP